MTVIMQLKRVFAEAFYTMERNKTCLLKALLPAGMLYYCLELFNLSYIQPSSSIKMFNLILYLLVVPHLLIIIHRVSLLGKDAVPEWGLWLWGGKELKFCFDVLVLIVVVGIMLMFLGIFISMLPEIITFLIVGYFVARFYLVIPSAATGQNVGLQASWYLTGHCKTMMFVVTALMPLLINIIQALIIYMFTGGETEMSVMPLAVSSLLIVPLMVFQVVLLSEAYRFCIKFSNEELTEGELESYIGNRKDIL